MSTIQDTDSYNICTANVSVDLVLLIVSTQCDSVL